MVRGLDMDLNPKPRNTFLKEVRPRSQTMLTFLCSIISIIKGRGGHVRPLKEHKNVCFDNELHES